jgi:pentatricopeptide repeat protein
VISFNASISSCEKANHWQQALEIFDEMLTELPPDVITCSALMSCCEKAGQWQQASRQDFTKPLLAC